MSDVLHIDRTGKNTMDRVKEITDKQETGLKNLFNSEQYITYLNTIPI